MKYIFFILLFTFINFDKKTINYKCEKNKKLFFFKNVSKTYMYLDKYKYKVQKIGIFDCKKRNCKLQKVINEKEFFSNKDFFKNCG